MVRSQDGDGIDHVPGGAVKGHPFGTDRAFKEEQVGFIIKRAENLDSGKDGGDPKKVPRRSWFEAGFQVPDAASVKGSGANADQD